MCLCGGRLVRDDGEFVGATGRPAWVAAVTEGRRISLQPLSVLRRRGLLTTTPRHEFVHVALEALGAGRAPLWLAEGLAAHVAGEGPSLSSALPRKRLSIEEVERGIAGRPRAGDARALPSAYAEVVARSSAARASRPCGGARCGRGSV